MPIRRDTRIGGSVAPDFGLWYWDAAGATLDPSSASIISDFLTGGVTSSDNMTLNKYGVAVANAVSGDPSYTIPRTDQGGTLTARIPLGTKPDPYRWSTSANDVDFDGHLSVRYPGGNIHYDMWQAEKGMRSVGAQALPASTLNVNRTENLSSSGFLRATTPVSSSSVAIGFDSGVMSYTGKTATTVTGVSGGTGTIPDHAEIFECDAAGNYIGKIIQCAAGVSFTLDNVNEQTSGWGGNAANTRLDAGLITPDDLINFVANGTIPKKTLQFGIPNIGLGTPKWPALHNAATGSHLSPVEGAWLRLNPAYNIATSGLPDLDKLILHCCQRHGVIVRDNAGQTTIYGLNPINGGTTWAAAGYTNTANSQTLSNTPAFPWSSFQALLPPGP